MNRQETISDLLNNRQDKLGTFVSNNIGICQSYLVEKLINIEFFSWDEVENLYPKWEDHGEGICLECEDTETDIDTNDLCESCFSNDCNPQDIFEWWTVDAWMADRLLSHGEPVLDNDFGRWWGRTTTGQSIKIDYVIAEIVADMEMSLK